MAERRHVQFQATGPAEHPGAAVERGAGREDVIDNDMAQGVIYARPPGECKGIFEVISPRPAAECGLGGGVYDAPQGFLDARPPSGRSRKRGRDERALIETPLAQFARVERHRHEDSSPDMIQQGFRAAKYLLQVGEDMPSAVVLELNDKRPRRSPQEHGGKTRLERRRERGALRTLPARLERAKEGVPACRATGVADKIEPARAARADVPVGAAFDQAAAMDAFRREEDIA